jgi:hypothetical protein
MADYFLQRHAWQLTVLAVAVAVVLGAVSFFVPSHPAGFLRGVILGMFLMLSVVWIRTK